MTIDLREKRKYLNISWATEKSGNEWEAHCHKILPFKYSDYEPGSKGSDFGLDGYVFNRNESLAFQIYGAEEETVDKIQAVKNKISKDIKKLVENRKDIAEIAGGSKFNRWVLAYNNKVSSADIQKHCRRKEDFIKQQNLPFIADDFQILIFTPDAQLDAPHKAYKRVTEDKYELPQEDKLNFDESNFMEDDRSMKILNKFKKIASSEKNAKEVSYSTICDYLQNQSLMTAINEELPNIGDKIMETRAAIEKNLRRRGLLDRTFDSLEKVEDRLIEELRASDIIKGNITSQDIRRIQSHITADLIVRCPIDFQEKEQ